MATQKTTVKSKTDRAALDQLMKEINKQHGSGSITVLGDLEIKKMPTTGSGSVKLNKILNGAYDGGYAKGRIYEIYGPESSGKTTLALHAVAEAQKDGGLVAYIDVENALDPVYAQDLGIDVERLIFSQPDSGEQALEIVQKLAMSGLVSMIVVDSVAALVPQAELDGEMGDATIGLHARLMSKALRKLAGTANRCDCTLILINQIREKVGVMFGNPETTPGGRALKFYASARLEVRRKDAIKLGSEQIGHKLSIKTAKNKIYSPMKTVEVDLIYGKGIDGIGDLLDVGVEKEIITKSGAWFSYKGEKIGQGRDTAKDWLKKNEAVQEEVMAALRKDDSKHMVSASDFEDEEMPETDFEF